MKEIPTYEEWRKALQDWCDQRKSLNAAAWELVIALGGGITPQTVVAHYKGERADVGWVLGRKVLQVVAGKEMR